MDRDDEIDDLYGLPLDEFTAARDDLAKRLRAAGDRDGAREVKTLRKPTVPAWAVNVATRRAPGTVDALFVATDRLARAQRRAASGVDAGTMRELTVAHRAAVDALLQHAVAALRDAGTNPATHLDEISATVLAGAVDAGGREHLRGGRLVRPLAAPGFGALTALSVVGDEPDDVDDDVAVASPDVQPASPVEADERAEGRAAAQRAWTEARAALRAARAEREALERRAPTLDTQAEAVEHEAAQLARRAEQAADAARAARAAAGEAAQQLERAIAAEAGAEEEVAQAAAAIEALDE